MTDNPDTSTLATTLLILLPSRSWLRILLPAQGAEKWIELIKEYSVPKELTAPLLNAMIEKILIHEATTNEDNERIQEIEIYYRFIGKVE